MHVRVNCYHAHALISSDARFGTRFGFLLFTFRSLSFELSHSRLLLFLLDESACEK